ncbi:MAG TPA: lipopolysaccharide assembly protein LapB [Pseudomonadales bacterium]|nr:lipopolysaccharide assembly protein LapB [Pseudomonadales bacterium]
MPEDLLLTLLFVAALAIGYLFGRQDRQSSSKPKAKAGVLAPEYFKGLSFLLNEKADEAIEVFIKALESNTESVETHLALGSLFRRKGDVERATRIHQNVLARPDLDATQKSNVRLELARDYLTAGLLDRAERLLKELAQEGGWHATAALEYLAGVFEKEKDWQSAFEIVEKLEPSEKNARMAAHYLCELADDAMAENDFVLARKHLKRALEKDKDCVRASLMLGKLEIATENYKEAIKALKKVRDQDANFISETLQMLKSAYEKLDSKAELIEYLLACLKQEPAISIVLMLSNLMRENRSDKEAAAVISEYLKRKPSIKGLNRLIDFHIEHSSGAARENLTILRNFTEQLIVNKPVYRCESCGMEAKSIYWNCPRCKNWGSMKPIHGLEGE